MSGLARRTGVVPSASGASRRTVAMAVLVACSLAACSIGPTYHKPGAPTVGRYTAHAVPGRTIGTPGPGGTSQHLHYGAAVPGAWWELFRAPALNDLVAHALVANPSVQSATAHLRAAEQAYLAQKGILYPQVNAGASVTRERPAPIFPGEKPFQFTVYSGSLNVTYYPDFFGANRALLAGAKAQIDYQRFEREASDLTLIGNVASTAVRIATLRKELKAAEAVVASDEDLLRLTTDRYRRGAEAYDSVLTQQAALAAARTSLSPLKLQMAQMVHALALLEGEAPGQFNMPTLTLSDISLPVALPVSLPSTLAEQRPDIRAAEAQLRAANASVKVAAAERFPLLTLSASLGRSSLDASQLFSPQSAIWNVAGDLVAPIFHGGTLIANERAAKAQYAATDADYRTVVLGALGQVADALRAVDLDAQTLNAQYRAWRASGKALKLARAAYEQGATDYLSLLAAEINYQNAAIPYAQAQGQRYLDTISLFVALGGGWWQDLGKPPAPASVPVAAATDAGGHR